MMSCICFEVLMKACFECLETLHDSAKYKRVCFALAALSFQDTSKNTTFIQNVFRIKQSRVTVIWKKLPPYYSFDTCNSCSLNYPSNPSHPCS